MSKKRRMERTVDLSDETKVFTNNIVDKDVQSIFLPFTLMQTLLLSPKYRIKNNIITPNNFFNICLLLCEIVVSMSVTLYGLFDLNKYLNPLNLFYGIYHFCGFFNNFIINLMQTRTIVAFILTIQEIHRTVNDEYNSKKHIRNSWISFAVIFCFYFTHCVSYCIVDPTIPIRDIVDFAVLIQFDCNIIYAIRFIKLLQNKIKEWNCMVYHSFHDNQTEQCRKGLVQAYFQILQSYQLYKNMFHQMILYYAVKSFFHSLLIVQTLIEKYQLPCEMGDRYIKLSFTILLSIWIFNMLILQTALSVQCEAFYIAMEDSQDTCAHILLSNCTDDDKKLFKNVRRAYRASFSKMRACRLFYVDVCFLLHLAALLTNYTIVLLQFALL